MGHTTTRRARRGAIALVAALAFSGCSHDTAQPTFDLASAAAPSSTNASPIPKASTTVVATTTTVKAAGTDAATTTALTAAVRSFWDVYLDVGAHTGSLDAATIKDRLATIATGDELRQLVAYFTTNKNSGFVVRGEVDVAPTVLGTSGAAWQVRDCFDDRTGLYRSDGSRVDTDNPLRHQVTLTLTSEGGVWKVASIKDGGFGCTL